MDWIAATGFAGMMLCWVGFALVFTLRKKGPEGPEKKRDSGSYWGIALQGVGYWMIWIFPRRYFSPIIPMPQNAEIAMAAITIVIAVLSVWLCAAAVKVLGKQWTYRARVLEGHELITEGPYSLVRNPIYLGMFGMLISTGRAVGRWPVLIGSIVAFLIGATIRIRAEEKLLREAFGIKFQDYAARVPAFFPGLF
jgi:protein-S-isoprenylcysteine O-methyltransferase Ste14